MVLNPYTTVLFFFMSSSNSIPPLCQRDEYNSNGCCIGYRWDLAKGQCVECSPGFTGLECSLKCPYPLFGENCQHVCKCSTTECSFVSGCLNRKLSTVLQPTTSHNGTEWFGTENTLTVQDITFTSVGYREDVKDVKEGDQIQTIWQVLIAILGVLTILTIKYIGKCFYRLWKSRKAHFGVDTTESDTHRTTNQEEDRVQRPIVYDLVENSADDTLWAPYEEIRVSSHLPCQIVNQDKASREELTDTSSSISTSCTINEVNDEIQLDKEVQDIDDTYITPCM